MKGRNIIPKKKKVASTYSISTLYLLDEGFILIGSKKYHLRSTKKKVVVLEEEGVEEAISVYQRLGRSFKEVLPLSSKY